MCVLYLAMLGQVPLCMSVCLCARIMCFAFLCALVCVCSLCVCALPLCDFILLVLHVCAVYLTMLGQVWSRCKSRISLAANSFVDPSYTHKAQERSEVRSISLLLYSKPPRLPRTVCGMWRGAKNRREKDVTPG
jgi:hypothetical protein